MNKYIVDLNVLKNIKDNYYFIDGIWEFIEKKCEENRFILLKELENEIKKGDDNDFLKAKFIKNKNFISFKNFDFEDKEKFFVHYKNIIQNLPKDVKQNSSLIESLGEKLDIWLVVYSKYFKEEKKEKEISILTDEKIKGNKLTIPFIAKFNEVDCVDFFEFLKKKGKKVKLI